MARFGFKQVKKFTARTQVFGGKYGPRIKLVTPGIKRSRRKLTRIVGGKDG